jgi:hypothetical protein
MTKKLTLTLMLIVSLAATFAVPTSAGEADALAGLLPELPDWKSQKAQPFAMDMGAFKLITVSRLYNKGDKSLSAVIIVGNKMMTAGKIQEMKVDTAQGSAEAKTIDGMNVAISVQKDSKKGAVVVTLGEGKSMGAMLTVAFEGLTMDEALETAKKLNWKKIKAETDKLLK